LENRFLAYYAYKASYTMIDRTPSYQLTLNPVIKQMIKRWNWHVKSVINAGTVLNLTLGAWMSYDVLVLTWMLARRSGESPTRWSMHLFL
jgi:hypothetical protein